MRGVNTKRPRDRATLQSQVQAIYNVYPRLAALHETLKSKATLVTGGFEGFCTPCGGLRQHKLGCPVNRGR